MNSKTAGALRKLKDADGRHLWSDGFATAEPARLLGYPVLIAEDMPDIGADATPIAFGDFALQAQECGWITSRQIEASRRWCRLNGGAARAELTARVVKLLRAALDERAAA
jgi:hypothetical protein